MPVGSGTEAGTETRRGEQTGRVRAGKKRAVVAAVPCAATGSLGRHARRSGEGGRIVGGDTVDDGQTRVDVRAMAGVDAAVDGGGEHDATALLQVDEAIPPSWTVGRQACAGDRHESAAIREGGPRPGG